MANIHQFDQNIRTRFGNIATDPENTPMVSAEYVNMKNYYLIVGVGLATAVAVDSTVTLTMYQATTTAGGGSASVCATTFTSLGSTSPIVLIAQVRGEDLSTTTTFHYVGWIMTTNDADTTVYGAGCLHQMRARYKQASPPA